MGISGSKRRYPYSRPAEHRGVLKGGPREAHTPEAGVPRTSSFLGGASSGPLKEGRAERKVPFGQREIEQRQKPRIFSYRGRGAGYGLRHAFDQVAIAPAIEVAEEPVAQIVLPTDGVDRVYRRRIAGRIAVAASAVIAVERETQSTPRRDPITGRPELLGQPGGHGEGDPSHRAEHRAEGARCCCCCCCCCCGGCAVALRVLGRRPPPALGDAPPRTRGTLAAALLAAGSLPARTLPHGPFGFFPRLGHVLLPSC